MQDGYLCLLVFQIYDVRKTQAQRWYVYICALSKVGIAFSSTNVNSQIICCILVMKQHETIIFQRLVLNVDKLRDDIKR